MGNKIGKKRAKPVFFGMQQSFFEYINQGEVLVSHDT